MIGQVCNQKVQNGILRHPHVICGGNIIEAKMLQEFFGMDYDRKKIAIQEICEHIWVPIKNNSICSLCGKKCEHYLSKQIDWNVGDSKGNCKICKIPVILDMRLKGGIVIVKTTKPLYEPVGIL